MMESKNTSDDSTHGVDEGVRKRKAASRDGDSDDDDFSDAAAPDGDCKTETTDRTSQLRREKRLAMNRESARARRKRKKILIETLENQVAELTKSNQNYRHKVAELEKELSTAKETIQILSRTGDPLSPQQRSNMLFNSAGQPSRQLVDAAARGEVDSNEAWRRLVEARSQSAPGQNNTVVGGNGQSNQAAEQLLRLEGLGHLNLSQHNSFSRLGAIGSSLANMDSPYSQHMDMNSRLGAAGTPNMNFLHRQAVAATTSDHALLREQLLMLQRHQQNQQHSASSDRTTAISGNSTTRAILLRQLLQEQELSLAKRFSGDKGS